MSNEGGGKLKNVGDKCGAYLNMEGEINCDNYSQYMCKMKTEKQTLDLTMQVTGASNGQFQVSRGDESLIGICFRAEKKWKKVNIDNSLEEFYYKAEKRKGWWLLVGE